MSGWRYYNKALLPVFHERFEARWGQGTAPFLDPEVLEQPVPRAQWINIDTGAALAVVPIWTDDDDIHRSFGVFYLPPAGDIWTLYPGQGAYLEPAREGDDDRARERVHLRNDAFNKAVAMARGLIEDDAI
ncbi:MAG TPA: hypothetical protein VN621_05960 [Arthrobacter sp.]|nr:hypothetical protein [Arthrobacter sp.]